MWGVTPPISMNGHTEKDLEVTSALEAELRANNVFESPEEAKLRYVNDCTSACVQERQPS